MKNNLQGYIELYKARNKFTKKEIVDMLFLGIPALAIFSFLILIASNIFISIPNLLTATLLTGLCGITVYTPFFLINKGIDKKSLKIKEAYPDVNIKISETKLKQKLVKNKILIEEKNKIIFDEISYKKKIEEKVRVLKQLRYDCCCFKVDNELTNEEMENIKIKVKKLSGVND